MNWRLKKNNTEDNSVELDNRESRESLMHLHWNTYKNHPATSRINTWPRFERERTEITSSRNSSNVNVEVTSLNQQCRRNINRSMYFQRNSTRNYYLREKAPDSTYKAEFVRKYARREQFIEREEKAKRSIYRSWEEDCRQNSEGKYIY